MIQIVFVIVFQKFVDIYLLPGIQVLAHLHEVEEQFPGPEHRGLVLPLKSLQFATDLVKALVIERQSGRDLLSESFILIGQEEIPVQLVAVLSLLLLVWGSGSLQEEAVDWMAEDLLGLGYDIHGLDNGPLHDGRGKLPAYVVTIALVLPGIGELGIEVLDGLVKAKPLVVYQLHEGIGNGVAIGIGINLPHGLDDGHLLPIGIRPHYLLPIHRVEQFGRERRPTGIVQTVYDLVQLLQGQVGMLALQPFFQHPLVLEYGDVPYYVLYLGPVGTIDMTEYLLEVHEGTGIGLQLLGLYVLAGLIDHLHLLFARQVLGKLLEPFNSRQPNFLVFLQQQILLFLVQGYDLRRLLVLQGEGVDEIQHRVFGKEQRIPGQGRLIQQISAAIQHPIHELVGRSGLVDELLPVPGIDLANCLLPRLFAHLPRPGIGVPLVVVQRSDIVGDVVVEDADYL